MTRLDVLSKVGPLKVATDYRIGGQSIRAIPANPWEFAKVEPCFTEMDGWDDHLCDTRRFEDLPEAARTYLKLIEEFTGVPVAIVSVGPDRDETIVVRPDLIWGPGTEID